MAMKKVIIITDMIKIINIGIFVIQGILIYYGNTNNNFELKK